MYLHLVDGHTGAQSHGVVQLFTSPHPHRLPHAAMPSLLPTRVRRAQVRLRLKSIYVLCVYGKGKNLQVALLAG